MSTKTKEPPKNKEQLELKKMYKKLLGNFHTGWFLSPSQKIWGGPIKKEQAMMNRAKIVGLLDF